MKAPEKLKKNIFETPEGYFEQLSGRIEERIQQENQARQTISLPRWSYAVAASVLLLLVAGMFFYQQADMAADTVATEQDIELLLASVSDETLMDYLQTDTKISAMEFTLTDQEQEELLFQELESYEIPYEDYEYALYELEEYL